MKMCPMMSFRSENSVAECFGEECALWVVQKSVTKRCPSSEYKETCGEVCEKCKFYSSSDFSHCGLIKE